MQARLVLLVEQNSWVLVSFQRRNQVEQIKNDENESKNAVPGQNWLAIKYTVTDRLFVIAYQSTSVAKLG